MSISSNTPDKPLNPPKGLVGLDKGHNIKGSDPKHNHGNPTQADQGKHNPDHNENKGHAQPTGFDAAIVSYFSDFYTYLKGFVGSEEKALSKLLDIIGLPEVHGHHHWYDVLHHFVL